MRVVDEDKGEPDRAQGGEGVQKDDGSSRARRVWYDETRGVVEKADRVDVTEAMVSARSHGKSWFMNYIAGRQDVNDKKMRATEAIVWRSAGWRDPARRQRRHLSGPSAAWFR